MNKIVREHYPASKLPEDLQLTDVPGATVRVTVEVVEAAQRKPFSEIRQEIEEKRRSGKWPTVSYEEGVARIRALRDEWDD